VAFASHNDQERAEGSLSPGRRDRSAIADGCSRFHRTEGEPDVRIAGEVALMCAG